MKHISQEDLLAMDRFTRANLINSISGIKPANLVGTVSKSGIRNLAIFSSVVHLGSNPPLLGMVQRPLTSEVGDTFRNIQDTGCFTINHVREELIEKAHLTSAKLGSNISEFDEFGIKEAFLDGFEAPFVAESQVRIGLKYRETIPIELNNTLLVIGEVVHISISEAGVEKDGQLDLEALGSVGISGLNRYYTFAKTAEHAYVGNPNQRSGGKVEKQAKANKDV